VRRPTGSGDAGFTLIELVVTIVIMGIIFVPLADFFIQYLDTYNQTQQRLSDSHDLQIVAAYFSQDVANTGLRNQTAGQTTFAPQQSVWVWASPTATTACGTAVAGAVLKLAWDDEGIGSGAGTDTIDNVVYLVSAGTLQRESCSQLPSGAATFAPGATLVHNLSGVPSVTCSTSCPAATPPASITLTVGVRSAASDTSATSVTLTGYRRESSS
jgi:prepilin-type N-terminal cleavage/methylation domain-containing protein